MRLTEIKHLGDDAINFITLLTEGGRLDFVYSKSKKQIEARMKDDHKIPSALQKLKDGDVADNLIKHFATIDPTTNKIYVQWMVQMYLSGLMLEDFDKLKEGLTIFERAKRQLAKKDINQYKTINELLKAIRPFADSDEPVSGKEKKAKARKEVQVIVDSPNFKIVVPKTYEASCIWGAGTSWCTKLKDTDSHFKSYSAQGPLYTIIAKKGNKEEKFQLHYESNQFMNADDETVNKSEIDFLSSFPQYKDFLNMLIDKHYSKYFE